MASASKSEEELQKLRVVDLRKELSVFGLPTTGKKDELVGRLFDHHQSQSQEDVTDCAQGEEGETSEDAYATEKQRSEAAKAAAEKASEENAAELKEAEERAAAEEAAQKKVAQEKAAAEKAAAEKAAAEKAAADKAAAEKAAAEKAAAEKAAAEKAAAEKAAAEKAAAEKAAAEKAVAEKAAAEKTAAEKAAAEKAAAEKAAAEKAAAEKAVELKAAAEKAAAEKAAAEKAAAEKAAAERAASERAAAERAAAERAAAERAAAEKVAVQKAAAEKAAAQKAAAEKAAAEKAAAEKAAAEKAAAEKAAAEKLFAAEQQRIEQEKAKAGAEAEQKKLADAARQSAEQRRVAEEQAAKEASKIGQKQPEAQKLAEQQRIAAAEQLRLAEEQEALKAMAQQKMLAERQQSDSAREQQMMALVHQQQALLEKQKSAQETSQRQSRMLQEQRQQLEAALRQNSLLQSQNKSNQPILEQLQQQRNQLLAQGEAISSQQSTLSERASTYMDHRQMNEQLMKQVMEQQQLKESEQQRRLLLERQQRLVAEHQRYQLAQHQALEQQAKSADLLRQQQIALLERQREQEETVRRIQQENHLREQRERDRRAAIQREVVLQREAELRAKREQEAAARKLEAEKRTQQEKKNQTAGPPSLLTMDTKPATSGLKLGADSAGTDSDRKLPKALEDVLALKDIRAKQIGVDMERAVEESRSSVTVRPMARQRPLGDVNEYDDDDDDEEQKSVSKNKESKNKKRKKKKKSRAARKAEEQKNAEWRAALATEMTEEGGKMEEDSGVEVEYVQEKPLVDITNPLYSQFHKVFETFKIEESVEPMEDKASEETTKSETKSEVESGVTKRGAALFGELDDDDDVQIKRNTGALSKKQLKKLTRMSVAELKTVVTRPDLVEMHDVTGPDPKLLLLLKATRNTVPVPRHWCNKRKYLQGKRGFEKPPFELPDYIQATGIMEMRQALADKETDKSMKQKMREKVRPKMGKIDIDYQKLHDAFFKYQRKPKMTLHGDLYYEGKEFETKLREKKPGNLTDELRTALGMPIGVGAERFPPPWLIAMQRYGPPPSYPNLKIPGLNAPIPEGCSFGYHAGGWGKPPVNELGKPLYGDVFGQKDEKEAEPVNEDAIDRTHWGEMESESEEESESESEEERDEDDLAAGLVTPAEAGLITPSGLTSIPAGMETPDVIELRKKIEDSMESGGGDTPALYQVLPEKRTSVGAAMMGSAHTYEVGVTKKVNAEGIEVTLNPEELDMDTVAMQAKYEQTVRQQQADIQKEDFSDMVAEHSAKAAKKRKKQQTTDKPGKKHKEFKF